MPTGRCAARRGILSSIGRLRAVTLAGLAGCCAVGPATAAPQRGDAPTLTEKTGRAIYILEERVKERLGLTVAPVVVAQAGQKLVLTEFGPHSRRQADVAPGAAR